MSFADPDDQHDPSDDDTDGRDAFGSTDGSDRMRGGAGDWNRQIDGISPQASGSSILWPEPPLDADSENELEVREEYELPPFPIDWNRLTAEEAAREWRDLDRWVTWLKTAFGLPPSIVPPFWHRHDELVWELSALHCHWRSCFHETASGSAPNLWMRDFADARHRLRDWVSICGTRIDRDRPTRQTVWPGEKQDGVHPTSDDAGPHDAGPHDAGGDVEIADRDADFEAFVQADLAQRQRTHS